MVAKLKGNKTFLIIGLSLVVVIPLLIVTFVIGKTALWLWLGIGLGMLYITWERNRAKKKQQQEEKKKLLRDWLEFVDEVGVPNK